MAKPQKMTSLQEASNYIDSINRPSTKMWKSECMYLLEYLHVIYFLYIIDLEKPYLKWILLDTGQFLYKLRLCLHLSVAYFALFILKHLLNFKPRKSCLSLQSKLLTNFLLQPISTSLRTTIFTLLATRILLSLNQQNMHVFLKLLPLRMERELLEIWEMTINLRLDIENAQQMQVW